MSRNIDLTKPLSDEDRAYLLSRDRHIDIARADKAAEAMEGDGPDSDAGSGESAGSGNDSPPEKYSDEWFAAVKVPELKEELRSAELPVSGTREELVERLMDYLEEDEADGEDDEDND